MDIFEYEQFTNKGFFTIRRSEKFWSGIWSDMTIEQVLMKAIKSIGSLTHGRGLTDSVITKWVLSMILLVEVCNEMENFCNVSYATSEQHVDTRVTRVSRDALDLQKIVEFFKTHDPFPVSENIMSISSGVIGDASINCFRAFEIGTDLQNKIINNNFGSVKFERKKKVVPLKVVNSSIIVDNEVVPINPLLIFQRLSLKIQSKNDMKNYLNYELALFPLSLFEDGCMRKTQKSTFYENFDSINELPSDNIVYIIDGGFLLHKVVWYQNGSIKEISEQYITYIEKHFSKDSYVVFDGYPDSATSSSTKSIERIRKRKNVGREIHFDQSTKITFSQEKFLSNENNKKNLITYLREEFNAAGIRSRQAEEDADVLIVKTATELSASEEKNVVIVGEDVDLLVILTQLAFENPRVFYLKPSRGKVPQKVFIIAIIQI